MEYKTRGGGETASPQNAKLFLWRESFRPFAVGSNSLPFSFQLRARGVERWLRRSESKMKLDDVRKESEETRSRGDSQRSPFWLITSDRSWQLGMVCSPWGEKALIRLAGVKSRQQVSRTLRINADNVFQYWTLHVGRSSLIYILFLNMNVIYSITQYVEV